MKTKICIKCRRELPATAFYRHPKMADGRLNACKACECSRSQSGYRARRDEILDYKRKRHGPAANESTYASRRRHREKDLARRKVLTALRTGRLVKQPCEVCGQKKVHAHHEDYSKPLQVRWLCSTHHGEAHRADKRTLIGETV